MVDKSWGGDTSATFRIRTNATPEQRAAERARAREQRASERAGAMSDRLEARSAAREAEMAQREQARTERREAEARLAEGDPHAAAAQRRRGSGRKDIVREDRDTSGYATVANGGRIRELVKRGASVASLAEVLGLTVEDIERALAEG
jgi:hypothetical protein